MAKRNKKSTGGASLDHEEVLKKFDDIWTSCFDEREQAIQDRRFYSIAGAQWEGALGDQFENKPKLEVNKAHLAVLRIINEQRNNKITVDYIPKDGSDQDTTADACNKLYRADEQDSSARAAYNNAFEEAVGGGYGAYRLRCCYEDEYDEDNDQQRIRIEPIYDADTSVFFDLDARMPDKSDATCCFVIHEMSKDKYEELYDDDPASWPKDITTREFDWWAADVVYVAEYYEVTEGARNVYKYKLIDGTEKKFYDEDFEDTELKEELAAMGAKRISKREVKRRRVHKWMLSGGAVLEDCGEIAGGCIPIIPVYGKYWVVDGKERAMGHVRLLKDTQRLLNMQRSKLAELAATTSTEKPIVTPEQIAGHKLLWAEDSVKNYPYLMLNPMTDASGNPMPAGPLAYTKAPALTPAMAALLQITDVDLKELMGNQEAGEEIQPNLSGKAIELVQTRLDMQSFIYMDNLAEAIRRGGEVWLEMAAEVYVEDGRKMKGISEHNEPTQIALGTPEVNRDGELVKGNDLRNAKYDVSVSVGPSSQSRRQATVRALTSMLPLINPQDMETQAVLTSMALMNLDGEGVGDVRDFFRKKLVRMGAVKPTEEEQEMLQKEAEAAASQPDPQAEYMKAEAAKAQADAQYKAAQTQKLDTDAGKVEAEAKLKEAQTMKTLQEIGMSEESHQIGMVKDLQGMEHADAGEDRNERNQAMQEGNHELDRARSEKEIEQIGKEK